MATHPTLVRFNPPLVGIVGNSSSMNQIRYGQIFMYDEDADLGVYVPGNRNQTMYK